MYEILEERRRKMLQAMLIGVFIVIVFAMGRDLFDLIRCRNSDCFHNGFMFPVNLSVLLVIPALMWMSKRVPSWLYALIWQAIVFAATVFTDTPEQLIAGKSSLVWVVAIIPAAFITYPVASLLSAAVASGMTLQLAKMAYGQIFPGIDLYFLGLIWLIALLAWLASRNMAAAIESAYAEQERLSAILENVADGIVVLGKDGSILRANPVALRFFEEDIKKYANPDGDTEVTVPDGRILALNWALVPDIGNVAVVRDVTRELEAARMKDAMLAVVSHELRTPLTGIMGAADLLRISQNDTSKRLVEIIYRNSRRLLRLVNDLLDRAQLESGEFHLLPSPFYTKELWKEIEDVLAQHREAAEKPIALELVFQGDLESKLCGDAGRIVQIARNLIDNAVKFTKEGKISVELDVADSRVSLKVSDTGKGISSSQLPDIWQPFRRASDFDIRNTQGVGLGLSIVHALVEQMHGKVDVTSTLGTGSIFTVILPVEFIS